MIAYHYLQASLNYHNHGEAEVILFRKNIALTVSTDFLIVLELSHIEPYICVYFFHVLFFYFKKRIYNFLSP